MLKWILISFIAGMITDLARLYFTRRPPEVRYRYFILDSYNNAVELNDAQFAALAIANDLETDEAHSRRMER